MSLVSTVASAAFALLPLPVRCPLPRKSEALREFETFLAGPARALPARPAPATVPRPAPK